MRNIQEQLTQYAAYHRDRRNIATHFVGVPVIVFSAVLALSQVMIGPVHLGWIGILVASIYYFWLDRPLGFAMLMFLLACGVVSSLISMKTSGMTALILAIVLFSGGWVVQFIGHKYEGMKPAFTDDIMGLIIGPLFVMAEVFFHFGWHRPLQQYIEARVGPTMAERNGKPIGPSSSVNAAS
jgi:uncharacterized membrane protein YGL010W